MRLTKHDFTEKFMKRIASAALMIAVTSMSQACFLAFHQPKVPQELYKLKNDK